MLETEKKPVVVIYEGENVLESLKAELVGAILADFKAGNFEPEQGGCVTFFTNKDNDIRLSYGSSMGLSIEIRESLPATASLQAIVDNYKRDAINAKLIELEKQKQALEKALEQL